MSESPSKIIGYIRVSTEEQRRDGVSLDAQRERIIAYCAFFKFELFAIYQDDSTGFDMNRPGLHAALNHIKVENATLVAIALDRISRNIVDIEYLMDNYFGVGCPYYIHLMDCAGIDSKTRDGRMMLRFKALMAQHQVETIRDRTQQGVRFAMKQGATVGRVPYGKEYSRQLDAEGRRIVVEVPEQMATISRIKDLYEQGISPAKIPDILQKENRPRPGAATWHAGIVRSILRRQGLIQPKHLNRENHIRDPQKALTRIIELRSQGASLRNIGRALRNENIAPPRGKRRYAQTISDLITKNTTSDKLKAIQIAVKLRDRGMSLRRIGEELMLQSITPPKGGHWHAEQVKQLIKDAQLGYLADTLMKVIGTDYTEPEGEDGVPPMMPSAEPSIAVPAPPAGLKIQRRPRLPRAE